MTQPLVSIVCLCYRQASFVQEAFESVWAQTYPNIELIVVDDGSPDDSAEKIYKLLKDYPEVPFLALPENVGNCRAFNMGLALCRGKYVIDLAADDVLLPERVEEGVRALEQAGREFAVHFSDVEYINPHGKRLKTHYKRKACGTLAEEIPQGWVYADLLERYFICTPSMMMRRSVLEELRGYDEGLVYEDFDFWVRSARQWQYCFTDKVLVKKRILPGSWSSRQYKKGSRHLESTLRVCLKARRLNRSPREDEALGKRLSYEIRQAVRSGNLLIALKMLRLKREVWPVWLLDPMVSYLLKGALLFQKKEPRQIG
ncbi:glycosyltransferase family 2 protein [Nafulsella turpanensis]|uniref:glycosyltransferase family 2 protein n=1 Tax=Nafulsella turpanensis TaxID=1265690 RepID=UPI0012687BEA|nr:glycosyltransferase [Nafulsella turpanensis]